MSRSDSEENDLIVVDAEDVGDFNPANILPLSVAELDAIRAWLQPTPYDLEQSEYSRHRTAHLAGTGKWLTSAATFKHWREDDDSGLLWIKGIPGSGKSVMAASIINQLQKEEMPVIYFFFRQIIDANHQPIAALRDWLCQVLHYSPPLQVKLDGYIKSRRILESLSPEDFWRDLKLALASLPRVYCVTDALDEMDQGNNEFLHSLAELGQWRPSNVKVLITSRPVPTIENSLRSFHMPEIRLEEHLVDTDIVAYVQCRLHNSSVPKNHWDTIKKAIPGRANGLFLYAKLSMDAFVESSTDTDAVLKALPADLNVMYNDILHEHAKRSNVNDNLQLLVLQFVTHATRPLRLLEIAGMVLEGDPTLRATKDLVRAACGPLVEILPDETISVVHHSFTEFLKGYTRSHVSGGAIYPVLHPGPTHQRLAIACLNYLESGCLDEKIKPPVSSTPVHYLLKPPNSLREKRLQYPFLEYAAKNWYTHAGRAARAGSDMSSIYKTLDEFFAEVSNIKAWQDADSPWDPLKPRPEKLTLLHIAAMTNLNGYVKYLLHKGEIELESRDTGGNTALHWGARSGSAEVVQALLDHGAKHETEGNDGFKALHLGASANHYGVVKVLLAAGADPLACKVGRRNLHGASKAVHSPLMYACHNGHVEAVAEFLPFLESTKDLPKALFWSAEKGHAKLVKDILQQSAADVNAKYRADTSLFKACQSGDRETISVLLNAGANPNILCKDSPDEFGMGNAIVIPQDDDDKDEQEELSMGKTALYAFCAKADHNTPDVVECVKLLLDAGADVNLKAPDGSTVLHIACRGIGKLVKLLLEAGADPTIEDNSGRTILHTRGETDEETLPHLLAGGLVDINKASGWDGRTPLHCRSEQNNNTPMLPFLQFKPDLDAVDSEGNTALHYSVSSPLLVKTSTHIDDLLAAGANPNIKNRKGDTPLHKIHSSEEFVLKLSLAGADIEARNNKGQTPLFAYAGKSKMASNASVFQCLIDSGARTDTSDFEGRTLLYQCINYPERFDYLLSLGLDPMATDYQNNSLLFEALDCSDIIDLGAGPVNTIKRLIHLGLDIDQPNNFGRTVLHEFLSRTGPNSLPCPRALDLILEACSNPSHGDSDGIQPLHIAAKTSPEYFFKLIGASADLFGITYEGMSVLHVAAEARQADIVCLIVSKLHSVADNRKIGFIDKQDRSGMSALHYACRSGRPETVKILLEAGANPNLKDNQGYSPFRIAAQFERELIAKKDDPTSPQVSPIDLMNIRLGREMRQNEIHRMCGIMMVPYISHDRCFSILTEDDTTRLEEILELLFAFGARVTGKKGCLRKAFDYAVLYKLDYTVDCLMRFQVRFTDQSGAGEHSEYDDYLICEYRFEATKKALRCGRIYHNPENEKQVQHGNVIYYSNFSEKLLFMRQYDLLKERLSTSTVSGAVVPATVNPTQINHEGESPLHLLVRWGYKELLAHVCTADMTRRFDDNEWCALAETEATVLNYPMIKPLLMTACDRLLPNQDVVTYLVEEMKINIDVKQGFRSTLKDGSYEVVFGEGVLHNLAKGKSWWHVNKAMPYLIERGANLEICDNDGKTPLLTALTKPNFSGTGPFQRQAAQVLIHSGANVNARDQNGNNCFSNAGSDMEMIKLLISHGAKIDKEAIESAIQLRQADVVEVLLSHSCHSRNRQPGNQETTQVKQTLLEEIDPEMTLLTAAIGLKKYKTRVHNQREEELEDFQTRLVELLLGHGANPYAILYSPPSLQKPPLGAIQLEQSRFLMSPNVSIDLPTIHHVLQSGKVVKPFFQLPSLQLEYLDGHGCTLLLAASKSMRTLGIKLENARGQGIACKTVLEELLDRGANTAAQDKMGKTVLHHLFDPQDPPFDPIEPQGGLDKEFVETILRSITLRSPDLVHTPDHYGNTPLHLALKRHSFHDINLLLENGADALRPDREGYTGLHYLARSIQKSECKDMFRKFLDIGVDINSRNNEGETPLFRYIANTGLGGGLQSLELAETLASELTEPCFDFFRENGADFFARNKGGSSLLHLLASFECASWVREVLSSIIVGRFKALMSLGLDPMVEDLQQRTSLDIAAACGNEAILKLFEQKPLG
ncbi:unnamed protein product [Penicillium pancosmium]